jgi:hypothetical protein
MHGCAHAPAAALRETAGAAHIQMRQVGRRCRDAVLLGQTPFCRGDAAVLVVVGGWWTLVRLQPTRMTWCSLSRRSWSWSSAEMQRRRQQQVHCARRTVRAADEMRVQEHQAYALCTEDGTIGWEHLRATARQHMTHSIPRQQSRADGNRHTHQMMRRRRLQRQLQHHRRRQLYAE